jgi:hypothetical protein
MKTTAVFFDHLLPPGPYQTVLELSGNNPELEPVIKKILTIAVARVIFSTAPENAQYNLLSKKILQENPDFLTELEEHEPQIHAIIRQTLDRTLLALTAVLQ